MKKRKVKKLVRGPRYRTLDDLLIASKAQLGPRFRYFQLARLIDRGVADNPRLVGHLVGFYLDRKIRWKGWDNAPKPTAKPPLRVVH